jgi:hypothetical protein
MVSCGRVDGNGISMIYNTDDTPITSDLGEVLSADEIGSILNDQEISEGK